MKRKDKTNDKKSLVTSDVSIETPTVEIKDVVKTKETKLSKKSVTSILDNLDGFSTEEQQNIKDVFKTLQDKGKITSGQGGGSSFETENMTNIRNIVTKEVEKVSDGFDETKTGLEKHYVLDKDGKKRYCMVYFRTTEQLNKTTK